MIEALEYLFVYVKLGILSHRHCDVHYPIQRSLDSHILVDALFVCYAQEDVSE